MDNKLKILNYLAKQRKAFTMNELSKILNIPYATFHRTIHKLRDLVQIQTIGSSKLLSLNNIPIMKSYLAISSEEEKLEFLKNQQIIKLIHEDLNTKEVVVLFGSYANNTQKKNSDIDILVLNSNAKKSISFNNTELLLNKEINPMFFTFKEFKLMLNSKEENVGKQALKKHIILNNPEKFWEVVM